MGVGGEMAKPGTSRIVEGEETRPHGEDRPAARGEADARAVGMAVVGRGAIDRVLIGVVRISTPTSDTPMISLIRIAARVIGIGLVSEGRGEESDRGKRPLSGRQDVKGQPILARFAFEMERIGAALQAGRNRPSEARLPAAIVEIVVVEMDGAIITGSVPPAHLAPAPASADDGARRQIDEPAMARPWPDIGDLLRVDAEGKIPAGEELGAELVHRGQRARKGLDKGAEKRRVLDLSGEMAKGRVLALRRDEHTGLRRKDEPSRLRSHDDGRCLIEPLLAERHPSRGRIDAEPQAIPLPWLHRRLGAKPQFARALFIRREARLGAARPDRQHDGALPAFHRKDGLRLRVGRRLGAKLHQRGQAEGKAQVALRTPLDESVRAEADLLAPPLEAFREDARQILEAHSRTRRIGIAAHDAHEARPIRAGFAQAHMRDEGLARTVREAVEISGDRKFGGVHLALFGVFVDGNRRGGGCLTAGPKALGESAGAGKATPESKRAVRLDRGRERPQTSCHLPNPKRWR